MIKKITLLAFVLCTCLLYSQTAILHDFEDSGAMGSDPEVTSDFGSNHLVTTNPVSNGNSSTNVLRLGRDFVNNHWYALAKFKLAVPYTIPANETRYFHVNVLYDRTPTVEAPITVQPDFRIRFDGADPGGIGSNGGLRLPDVSMRYTNPGKWQDLVIPITAGASAITVNWINLHQDAKVPEQVLNSATDFCYVDNIEFSERSVPRNLYGETIALNNFEDSGAMGTDPEIVSLFGANSEVVVNPNTKGNTSANVLRMDRTVGNNNWYVLSRFKMETLYPVPANESRYLHFNVLYDRTGTPTVPLTTRPDFAIRWDARDGAQNGSNNGILRPSSAYIYGDEGEWQEVVIEIPGGTEGKAVSYMMFHPDAMQAFGLVGGAGDTTYKVLNAATDFCYIDNVQITNSATPTILNTWSGATSNDWNDATNWEIGVPSATRSAEIPTGQTVEITGSTGVTVKDLTVTAGANLNIKSGGSLIVNETSTGEISYERTIAKDADLAKAWYSVASPVSGETLTKMQANNNLANGTGGSRVGLATYSNITEDWSYFTTGSSEVISPGTGLIAKLDNTTGGSALIFKGTYTKGMVEPTITQGTNNFNFVGNPFTSYINLGTFFTDNAAADRLDEQTIWIWDENKNGVNMGGYVEKMSGADAAFEIAPGQGFFVSAGSASNNKVTFNVANQSHKTDSFLKKSRPEIELKITQDNLINNTKLYFIDGTTTEFDNGFDGSMFTGVNYDLAVYTELIVDNNGRKLGVQSLPNSDLETLVIPVGIKATSGKEIVISANASNLPEGIKVILEDREKKSLVNLSNGDFKFVLNEKVNGSGRFFIHTSSRVLSTENNSLTGVNIYQLENRMLKISGIDNQKGTLHLYNILGREIVKVDFKSTNTSEFKLPKIAKGMYIVKLETEKGSLNKKIILK
ncbi:T9SS type A sorting domain-containing protein [Polaribacter sp. Hel_I_88]|uniref:T9SS type A sorting domain-containing protein n=1 Tax=Polaribacter sp. Hel_I_88 TaxID=1250006 RepID=UPI00047E5E76|nr:T9SS type A sorting domain-containing protein [Polaribacter sp. Hel_I_88]